MELPRRTFLQVGAAATAALVFSDKARADEINPLVQLLTTDKNTRLVDQNGNVFSPESLDGKTVMTCSGWFECPVCDNIKGTLEIAQKSLKDKSIQLVVFNTKPETNFVQREDYIKMYTDAGFDASQVKILFTQTRPAGADARTWKADPDAAGDFNNKAAAALEKRLMKHAGPGHSVNVVTFNKKGERMGNGIASDEDTENARTIKAGRIINDVEKALGLRR